MKTKLSITLSDWDTAILDEALDTMFGRDSSTWGLTASDKANLNVAERSQRRNWYIGWAVRAVAAEIVRTGGMPLPLGVHLVHEDKESGELRVNYGGCGPTGIGAADGPDFQAPRFRLSFPE